MPTFYRLPGWVGLLFGSSSSGASSSVLMVWYRRQLQRRYLKEMEPRLLADIGITRQVADKEARKPFWAA